MPEACRQRCRSALDAQPLVAPLPNLHHGSVEAVERQVELPPIHHAVVDPYPALFDQPSRLASAEAKQLGEQGGQVDRPVGGHGRLLDLLGLLVAHVQAVEVLLGRLGRAGVVVARRPIMKITGYVRRLSL